MADQKTDNEHDYFEGLIKEAEKELGPEQFKSLKESIEQIGLALYNLARHASVDGKDVSAFVENTRDFSNNLYGRAGSENLNPDVAFVALKGANALIAPEPLSSYDDAAKGMIDALKNRYGGR